MDVFFFLNDTATTKSYTLSLHDALPIWVIAKFGTDEQKKRYLPGLAAGELIGSFALTEAEAGSDPAGLRTTARRDGDEWVINGDRKSTRLNSSHANISYAVFCLKKKNRG